MNERYKNLYSLEPNTYSKGSPVIIEAGALLKDNDENKIIAQLKLISISNLEIIAVKVKIDSMDPFGSKLDSQEAQYLDLDVHRNQEFGQQIPIVLKDGNARSFSVTVHEVVFADKSKWVNENEQAAQSLNVKTLSDYLKNDGLVEQYDIENGGDCHVVPTGFGDLWVCTCGSFNENSEIKCNNCGKSKSQIDSIIDIDALKEKRAVYEKNRNYSQAQELMASELISEVNKAKDIFTSLGEYENAQELISECDKRISNINEQNKAKEEANLANRKRIKRVRIVICSIVGIVLLVSGALYTLTPNYKYSKAQSYLRQGQYDKAMAAFEKLGDYKDSESKIAEVRYQHGKSLLEERKYDESRSLFKEIMDYKDSRDYLNAIIAAQWYENTYDHDSFISASSISSRIKNLLSVKSKVCKEYANTLLEDLYNQCSTAVSNGPYKDLGANLDYLKQMDYKSDECEKLEKEYIDKFSWYDDNLYVVNGYSMGWSITLDPNYKDGTVTVTHTTYLSATKSTIDDEYTCNLEPDHNLECENILGNIERFRVQKDSIEYTDGHNKTTTYTVFVP